MGESIGNEPQEAPKTETDEIRKDAADEEGRHTADGAERGQNAPDEQVEENGGAPTAGRRRTLEDAKGVLHHGIASSSASRK